MATPVLHEISAAAFLREDEAIADCLARVEAAGLPDDGVFRRARALVEVMREKGGASSIEAFLGEYGLETKEGVALLCIAESLLRIPDGTTGSKLIDGLLAGGDWEKHLGHSHSPFVNASSWGLLLTGKVLSADEWQGTAAHALGGLVHRLSEPVAREAIKAALRLAGRQFVMGQTIDEAIHHSQRGVAKGYCYSFDMLGEGARTAQQAAAYFEKYRAAIRAVGKQADKHLPLIRRTGVSIKLSALHPRLELRHEARVMEELIPQLILLCKEAHDIGIPLSIDAEEATRFDLYVAIFETLLTHPELEGYEGLGFVLQAYQKRALATVGVLRDLAMHNERRIPVRLVKGAYWDSEIKAAQEQGLEDYPVFTRKSHTDVSYLACAAELIANPECFYPQFATHNALTVAAIEAMAGDAEYEFQRLFGMGEGLYDQLVKSRRVRVYAPVGNHEALLPYLIRRLLENGANNSFVHVLVDTSRPLEELLADPIAKAVESAGRMADHIPLPRMLYPDRLNSRGLDFGNRASVMRLLEGYAHQPDPQAVADVSLQEVDIAIGKAVAAQEAWDAAGVEQRTKILRKIAEALEARQDELITAIVREAYRTFPDALAEVREAADFCRYYAERADALLVPQMLDGPTGEKNTYRLCGRGAFVCISPWNFPLAIFTGQVVAALVTGNSVLAKPAEQTPYIAARAVQLMHEAGVPKDVLQLLPGRGESVGAALIHDARIAGVAFTGSTATAQIIARALAGRNGPIIPLIAETGGINAMLVDSSALVEQTVDDIIRSAFGSAGQRCSALRVLLVQEEIADELLDVLSGAMAELRVDNPAELATDVGPLVDKAAHAGVSAQITVLEKRGRLIVRTPTDLPAPFMAPCAYEIDSLEGVTEEIFGPVLQVMRFKAKDIEAMFEAVNGLGYGLTFGLQSRLREHRQLARKKLKVGNLYINRSIIGATVGVQPFGGEGLSGTGPKAGSPYTLLRFAGERAVSENTAAIGGNIDLLK